MLACNKTINKYFPLIYLQCHHFDTKLLACSPYAATSLHPVLKSLFQGCPVHCQLPLADKFARHDGCKGLGVVWKRIFVIRYCKIRDIKIINKFKKWGVSRTLKNVGVTRTHDWPRCTGHYRTDHPLQQTFLTALFTETLSSASSLLSLEIMLIWHFLLLNV